MLLPGNHQIHPGHLAANQLPAEQDGNELNDLRQPARTHRGPRRPARVQQARPHSQPWLSKMTSSSGTPVSSSISYEGEVSQAVPRAVDVEHSGQLELVVEGALSPMLLMG